MVVGLRVSQDVLHAVEKVREHSARRAVSGHGRELSHLGIREFVNIKTVYVK